VIFGVKVLQMKLFYIRFGSVSAHGKGDYLRDWVMELVCIQRITSDVQHTVGMATLGVAGLLLRP